MVMSTLNDEDAGTALQLPVQLLLFYNHQGFRFYSKATAINSTMLTGTWLLVQVPSQGPLPYHCAIPNTYLSLIMDSSHGRQAAWLFLFLGQFQQELTGH